METSECLSAAFLHRFPHTWLEWLGWYWLVNKRHSVPPQREHCRSSGPLSPSLLRRGAAEDFHRRLLQTNTHTHTHYWRVLCTVGYVIPVSRSRCSEIWVSIQTRIWTGTTTFKVSSALCCYFFGESDSLSLCLSVCLSVARARAALACLHPARRSPAPPYFSE